MTAADSQPASSARATALDLCALALAGLVVMLPFAGSDVRAVGDHACHLEELRRLATLRSYDDVAVAGLDILGVHSPLLYGLLAIVVHVGAPIQIAYLGAVLAGYVSVGVASYLALAGRPRAVRFVTSATLMLAPSQGLTMWGPLFGMWTSAVSLGLVLAIVPPLADPRSGTAAARAFRVALFSALAVFAHTFALYAITALGAARVLMWLLGGARSERGRDAAMGLLALGLGLVCAFGFWGTAAMAYRPEDAYPMSSSIDELVRILFFGPRGPHDAADPDPLWSIGAHTAEAALVALGIVFAPRAWKTSDEAARLAMIAASVLAALTVLAVTTHAAAFGPLPFRLLAFSRAWVVFVVAAAVPSFGRWAKASPSPSRSAAWSLAALMLLTALATADVAHGLPPSDALADLDRVTTWIGRHPIIGRTWAASPGDDPTAPRALRGGNPMAVLASAPGTIEFGGFYSRLPTPTAPYAETDEGLFFGEYLRPDTAERGLATAASFGVNRFVLWEPGDRAVLASRPELASVFVAGTFEVFDRVVPVRVRALADGALTIDVHDGDDVPISTAYSPYLRLEEGAEIGARLERAARGLTRITNVPSSGARLRVHFERPWAPWLVSLAGLSVLGVVGLRAVRERRSSPS